MALGLEHNFIKLSQEMTKYRRNDAGNIYFITYSGRVRQKIVSIEGVISLHNDMIDPVTDQVIAYPTQHPSKHKHLILKDAKEYISWVLENKLLINETNRTQKDSCLLKSGYDVSVVISSAIIRTSNVIAVDFKRKERSLCV